MAQTTVAGGFIDADLVSAQTALTSGLVSTDELIISDAGVLKRMDVSVLEDYIVTNLGDNNIDVAQSSHGFAVGDVIRMTTTNNTYAKALADTAPNAEVIGIVIDVTDSNNFTYATSGEITVAAAVPNSTTAGDIVYLSTSSAGGTQTTEPSATDQISKPIAIITEANNKMVLVPFRGEIISGGATSFAPVDATYVTLGVNGTLSGERVLTGGSGITLTDAGANGAATISVTSLGITGAMMAANTITGDKIAVGSDTQGDILYYNGTDYVRLAADNGKYLRSNGNSSNPSWETVSGTTINTNADNRVITGSGTANTLNGETNLTWNGTTLIAKGGAAATSGIQVEAYTTANYPARLVLQKSNNATVGSHTTLEANEILGAIDFLASDGDSFELGARIRVDSRHNAWSASNRGSKMRIYTVPPGATDEGNGDWQLPVPYCKVYRGSTQTISSGSTEQRITWDGQANSGGTDFNVSNGNAMHSSSNTDSINRVYVWTAGVYAAHTQIRWQANATGERNITLKHNGNQVARENREADVTTDDVIMHTMGTKVCAVGDYFEVFVTQRSGGNLLVRSGEAAANFSVWRIA